VKKQIGSYKM